MNKIIKIGIFVMLILSITIQNVSANAIVNGDFSASDTFLGWSHSGANVLSEKPGWMSLLYPPAGSSGSQISQTFTAESDKLIFDAFTYQETMIKVTLISIGQESSGIVGTGSFSLTIPGMTGNTATVYFENIGGNGESCCKVFVDNIVNQEMTYFVEGIVIGDNSPHKDTKIEGAFVSIEIPQKGITLFDYTDINGYYYIDGIPTGQYNITVSAPGYTTATHTSEVANRDFLLSPEAPIIYQLIAPINWAVFEQKSVPKQQMDSFTCFANGGEAWIDETSSILHSTCVDIVPDFDKLFRELFRTNKV